MPAYTEHVADKSYWTLKTSYSVMLSIARQVEQRPLKIDISVYNYEAVGSLQHPNHFVCSSEPSHCFSIGTSVVVAKTAVSRTINPKQVELGFGVCISSETKQAQSQGKKNESMNTAKMRDVDAKGKQNSGVSDDVGSNEANVNDAADRSSLSTSDKLEAQDPFPIVLERSDPKAAAELEVVASHLSQHEMEPEDIGKTDKLAPGGAPAPASLSSTSGAKVRRFSSTLGLTGLYQAKRPMVCVACNQKIEKGDYRFEHFFSQQRPPRSIHTECVAQIDRVTIGASITWLQSSMSGRPRFEQMYIQRALEILNAMGSVA